MLGGEWGLLQTRYSWRLWREFCALSDIHQGHHCYLSYLLPVFTFHEWKCNKKAAKCKKKKKKRRKEEHFKTRLYTNCGFFSLSLLKIQVEDLPLQSCSHYKISPSNYRTYGFCRLPSALRIWMFNLKGCFRAEFCSYLKRPWEYCA